MPADAQPRRVLMSGDAVGGVWDYALELARGLGARGTAVTLATMGPRPTPDRRAAAARIEGLDLAESDFKLEWMHDPWQDVSRAGEWLLQLEARLAPDLVHLNGYAHAALPWRAPRLVAAHSCVCSWWRAVRQQDAPAEWDGYRRAVRRGLDAAHAVVAPTGAMLRALAAHYGPVEGSVIPNGRDLPQCDARKEPLVLCAGRLWDEAKNIAALAAVARGLRWTVAVAGETCDPSGASRVEAGVTCLGRLAPEDLHTWMSRASIYAAPARYEPFGLSVLEAARLGCALVLGDIPSLRELWDGAATFVPPGDAGALRAALDRLIDDDGGRAEQGRRAAARAREYSAERMTRSYCRTYGMLLGHPGRESCEVVPCAS